MTTLDGKVENSFRAIRSALDHAEADPDWRPAWLEESGVSSMMGIECPLVNCFVEPERPVSVYVDPESSEDVFASIVLPADLDKRVRALLKRAIDLNDKTRHVFKWLTESGQADPDAMVAEALRKAEEEAAQGGKSAAEAWELAVEGVMDAVRKVLLDALSGALPDGLVDLGEVSNSRESLWRPLLVDALLEVRLFGIAQSLLIRAGKWRGVPNGWDFP